MNAQKHALDFHYCASITGLWHPGAVFCSRTMHMPTNVILLCQRDKRFIFGAWIPAHTLTTIHKSLSCRQRLILSLSASISTTNDHQGTPTSRPSTIPSSNPPNPVSHTVQQVKCMTTLSKVKDPLYLLWLKSSFVWYILTFTRVYFPRRVLSNLFNSFGFTLVLMHEWPDSSDWQYLLINIETGQSFSQQHQR